MLEAARRPRQSEGVRQEGSPGGETGAVLRPPDEDPGRRGRPQVGGGGLQRRCGVSVRVEERKEHPRKIIAVVSCNLSDALNGRFKSFQSEYKVE